MPVITSIGGGGGDYHTFIITENGDQWSSGSNEYGQMSNGGNQKEVSPVHTEGLSDVKAIAAGSFHPIALKKELPLERRSQQIAACQQRLPW
ncbi:hypothetical protein [Paenibacillus sp. sgz302251]|uniref:hypothetical protein n=1 Tax=Paenibacillus sp. sgz302251 TaxID=3414493 RepID=UPI003C7A383B